MGKAKPNQINYQHEYNKRTYNSFYITFHKEKDKELIDDLNNQSSKAEFIRMLYKEYKKHN